MPRGTILSWKGWTKVGTQQVIDQVRPFSQIKMVKKSAKVAKIAPNMMKKAKYHVFLWNGLEPG